MHNFKTALLVLTILPWLIAEFVSHHPVLSYFLAWGGSLWIFYFSILSPYRCLDRDRALSEQLMRPIVLIQLLFAGLMCVTSIFYFWNHLGFVYFRNISHDQFHINQETILLARCQRMTLLAHTALVWGMLLLPSKSIVQYKCSLPIEHLLLWISLVALPSAYALNFFPALSQLKLYLLALAGTAQTLLLIRGLVKKNLVYICYGGVTFLILLGNATLTGFKEIILLHIITFCFLAFPYYKKTVTLLFFPVIYLLLYVLPTFTTVIRTLSWEGKKSADIARTEALDLISQPQKAALLEQNNWMFLTKRFSEITMFCKYLETYPDDKPYLGMQILDNAFVALIPRVVWPDKPNTEKISMERVYEAGVIHRASSTSAKTRPVIDGYLSAGLIGVFFTMLVYGIIVQTLANAAERLFGGYSLGCTVIFNSIFQPLWRGNNWEFLLNNLVYGCIIMIFLFYVLRFTNVLKPKTHDTYSPCNPLL